MGAGAGSLRGVGTGSVVRGASGVGVGSVIRGAGASAGAGRKGCSWCISGGVGSVVVVSEAWWWWCWKRGSGAGCWENPRGKTLGRQIRMGNEPNHIRE